jgi:hypothetical protein
VEKGTEFKSAAWSARGFLVAAVAHIPGIRGILVIRDAGFVPGPS